MPRRSPFNSGGDPTHITDTSVLFIELFIYFCCSFFLRNEFDGSFTAQSLEYRHRPVSEKHVPGSDIEYIKNAQPDLDVR